MSDTAVFYNPFEPGFAENPYPQYQALREADPVHASPLGIWVLFRHADIARFLRDPKLSVEDQNATAPTALQDMAAEVLGDDAREVRGASMLGLDDPDHARLRRLVQKAFTPRTIEQLRPRIQQLVDAALDGVAERGSMELIGDLAFPLPFAVISELLGTPDTDTDALRQMSGMIVRSLEPVNDPEVMKAIARAADDMNELITSIIAYKREHPADDMLTALISAEEEGDVLTNEELVSQVALLYIAGHETTVNLIGNGVLALLRHRDQLDRLVADPSLDANAVEELLRYDPPVQMSRRITLADVEIDGKTIPQGTFVGLMLASGNRDPLQWGDTADVVDLGRQGAQQHLAFGGGAHHCLGAALARLEGQAAIGSLVRRFPHLDLVDEPPYNGRINLRGVERMTLSLG